MKEIRQCERCKEYFKLESREGAKLGICALIQKKFFTNLTTSINKGEER